MSNQALLPRGWADAVRNIDTVGDGVIGPVTR
jgi:hypothetical protein